MNLALPAKLTSHDAAIFVSIPELILVEHLAFQVMALDGTRKVIYS